MNATFIVHMAESTMGLISANSVQRFGKRHYRKEVPSSGTQKLQYC